MQTVNIDPSSGAVVNIGPVFWSEDLNVYFRNKTENWTGSFAVEVWNSAKKNTSYPVVGALTVVDDLMTLRLAPEVQGLPVGNLYYEIWNNARNRIYLKGQLKIEE